MKRIKIFTITALVLGLLFGCSGGETAQEGGREAASDGGPVKIEFWYGLGSVAGETMEEIIQEFNNSQYEVVVTGVQQASYGETWQKVQAALAAGDAPAVFLGDVDLAHAYGGDDGILESFDDYINTDEFNRDDILPVFLEPGIYEDKVYGIPAYGTTQIMYYNTKIFDEAGVDPDEAFASWENLAKASKIIQEKTDAEYGHMIMWGTGNLIDMALSNGGKFLSDDGKEVLINSPEWVEAWEFARKQIHEEKNMGIITGGQGWEYWYKTIDYVMTGKAGSYTGSSGDRGDLDFSYIDAREQPGMNGNDPKPVANGIYLFIPKAKEQAVKDAAFKWIEYFISPEVQAKWSMEIGYIPVRESTMEVAEYKRFIEENPYAGVPYEQALHASPRFIDPTGTEIWDVLRVAVDKIELENIPAQEALDEAKEQAQQALDEVYNE